jgi:transcriptional regulator with PAS, ATPase and Fis domain
MYNASTQNTVEQANKPECELDFVVGNSKSMLDIMSTIKKIKDLNTTVLITGETGTGKSLIAKHLHSLGKFSHEPFIHINCAGIPSNLMESELFGYERGAFTGATLSKPGKFELARSGTIFLDEISTLSFELQAKLLTVLEERKIERLGGTKPYEVKAKIIAASNDNLETMVKEKKFREDLFYRLNVIQIDIPPLRQHREDIVILANHFIEKYRNKFAKSCHIISDEVWDILKVYDWPGNIRELENVIERAVALASESIIGIEDIDGKIKCLTSADDGVRDLSPLDLNERTIILEALRQNLGSRTKTADFLGVSRRTLQYKIKRLKII